MTSSSHLLSSDLPPEVDTNTCSPEMLNSTGAEINTRIKATNLNQTVDGNLYIWVSCGTVLGKLHKNKFFCPGIHMKCIEIEEGDLVTPKSLVILAEKEKLKDWKTAVRVNGMTIRRYMERGLLDFCEHASSCTMKCLSRAGAGPYLSMPQASQVPIPVSSYPSIVTSQQQQQLQSYVTLKQSASASRDLKLLSRDVQGAGDMIPIPREALLLPDEIKSAMRNLTSPLNLQLSVPMADGITDNFLSNMQILHDAGASSLSPDYVYIDPRTISPVPVPQTLIQVPLATTTVTSAANVQRQYMNTPAATSTPQPKLAAAPRAKRPVKKWTATNHPNSSPPTTAAVTTDNNKVPRKPIGTELNVSELKLMQENEDCQVFWKGILRVGMLDQVVEDIVTEIQNLKRNLVMSGVGKEEARQFSKVVKQLGMAEKIQKKVMTQKYEMQKQKEMLRKEMSELKKRVALAEQKQYDLKRKAASLDQLMDFSLKRPTLMADLSGVDSDSDDLEAETETRTNVAFPEPEVHVTGRYVNIKTEVHEEDEATEASSDTSSMGSHMDTESQSMSPSQSHTDLQQAQWRQKRHQNSAMLEIVLNKLKEK